MYFVTFRMADSLPRERFMQFCCQRNQWLLSRVPADAAKELADGARDNWLNMNWRRALELLSQNSLIEYHRTFSNRIQELLDAGSGSCVLRSPELATEVAKALKYFDGSRYLLDRYVVMPNHVHVLFRPVKGHTLSAILHSWKSYTAKALNRKLGRTGKFWQEEYYDHIVRNLPQLHLLHTYIERNPEKARLRPGEYLVG